MNLLMIGIIIFIASITIIELLIFAFKNVSYVQSAKVKNRLRKFTLVEKADGTGDILKKQELSSIPWLNKLLLSMPLVTILDRLVIQANTSFNSGFYLLLSITLGLVGYLIAGFFQMSTGIVILIALISASLPCINLMRLKNNRIKKFRSQLPEALELIARSLKAGHAFTSGMKMVSTEFDDPLGTEFDETLNEINFGVNMADALKNMADRTDCEEAKFFVTAVVLQRETGGNLATILESLSKIIRKKFEFQDKINTLTAEGRISALILVLLPFFVAGVIYFLNREYLLVLFNEPVGQFMLILGSLLMAAGILVIRKIIEIKV
jgi:tight adherence protein B